MKFLLAILVPLLILGCGILEMLFPINNMPQRYIERNISEAEIIGTWDLTPDSETGIKEYFDRYQNDVSDQNPVRAPWKSIVFKSDGACQIDLEIAWVKDNRALSEPDALFTCTWKIKNVSGYDKNLSQKDVPGVFIRFERYNSQEDQYYVHYHESYIVEEDNELVLWYFIGDPTRIQFQDFKKVK